MQLIYRGVTYHFSAANHQPCRALSDLSRSLFYRGLAYTCQMSVLPSCPQPIAVNWRYQLPMSTYGAAPKLA